MSISNSKQPNDQMSVRLSSGFPGLLGTHIGCSEDYAFASTRCRDRGGLREVIPLTPTLSPRGEGANAFANLLEDAGTDVHMKRTNLVLDGEILEEALRLSGERTYSKAVDRALAEFVRRIKAGRILRLAGSGLWEDDLAEMRGDRPRRPRRAADRETRRVSG